MGTQKNRLSETILLSTHNIGFDSKIRVLKFEILLLFRALIYPVLCALENNQLFWVQKYILLELGIFPLSRALTKYLPIILPFQTYNQSAADDFENILWIEFNQVENKKEKLLIMQNIFFLQNLFQESSADASK